MLLDILTGRGICRATQRHRAKEFMGFLPQIDRSTPKELNLHIILDTSSTQKTTEAKKLMESSPRFIFHFTPTSASWLNAVEGWFSQLERRAIYRGFFTSVKELRNEIHRFIKVHNAESAKSFKWAKSAKSIIEAVDRAKDAIN